MKETVHFNISTGLKSIIGKDLITDQFIAIFELVKNSFDAEAKNIGITIDSSKNEIIISDDGKGMTHDDITDKWLFVAYSEKQGNKEKNYAGSKGIGRFSCDRLGGTLSLQSRRMGQNCVLFVDWGEFERDSTEQFNVMDITLERGDKQLTPDIYGEHGTALIINKLREEWTSDDAKKVVSDLQRLRSPFEESSGTNISVSFVNSDGVLVFTKQVENHIREVLDKKTIHISCQVEHKLITVRLSDGTTTVYTVNLENSTGLEEVFFDIFYLNQKAKNNFHRIMGVRTKDYGSIFVYRNNYRIPPYGEPEYDTFGLNKRKNQGYNRYLADRELLGYINVVDKDERFKEVSSRDGGFVRGEGSSLNVLIQAYMDLVHRPLEEYMQLVKFGESSIDEVSSNKGGDAISKLLNRFHRKFFVIDSTTYELPDHAHTIKQKIQRLEDIKISAPEKNRLLKEVSTTLSALQNESDMVKRENDRIRNEQIRTQNRAATLERLISRDDPDLTQFLFHEMSDISAQINASISDIVSMMNEGQRDKFSDYLSDIRKSSDRLSSIEERIRSGSFKDPDDLEMNNLGEHIETYISSKPIIRNRGIELSFNLVGLRAPRKIREYDFDILLDNLVKNAIDSGCTRIDVLFDSIDTSLHFVSDSGPIKTTPITDIFRLGVSSKINGTGIGLFMCARICEEFGWSISVSQQGEHSVDFKISMGSY